MSQPRKFYLRRVGINSGGYDRQGCYWGVDLPLYECTDEHGNNVLHLRASTREIAKAKAMAFVERQFDCKAEFYK